MFTKLTPQKVKHDSGYIVQTGSRESLQYLKGNIKAEVKADFGNITRIYRESLVLHKDGVAILPSIEEHELILKHITDALTFLGENYELL